ncbi:MAG TPA: alpha/beta fold hydrolase [Nocardioides sp.]|nr:alpha/beta fold hydrolase [Nocardioides sp.]
MSVRPVRRLTLLAVVVTLAGTLLAVVGSRPAPAATVGAPKTLQVGELTLTSCKVVRRAFCGKIRRAWEPGNPSAGTVKVGFAFVPARRQPAIDTLVPHEGGPGYSTTGTGADYAAMYGPLLDRRNLLLFDQRGTGLSRPIRCPDLQNLVLPYNVAAGRCGRSLGKRADDYTTSLSADDLAAVLEKLGLTSVSLYGDSYGTFFTQTFAGRHPEMVRSIVLDSAYPTYGESAWYPTQSPAMRNAFTKACQRSQECRSAGLRFLPTLRRVLDEVRRQPWRGTAYDADGRRAEVTVDGAGLAAVAFGATYAPAFYRELTAALRSGLRGDRAPLLRLVAEAEGGGTYAGPANAYSEGLDAAVACHDYPQLYNMKAPPAARERQLERAIVGRTRTEPRTYAPFSVREYADSDWQSIDWCTRWPVAPKDNPAGPIRPAGGYPDAPVLVLSGELDSITTAAEGNIVKAQFPNARHVLLRNSFHVTALSDRDGCGQRILRAFVRSPGSERSVEACAKAVQPLRALGIVPRTLADITPARSARSLPARVRRAGPAAALTVEDVATRWWNNYSGSGVGLRGGAFSYTGNDVVKLRLKGYRLLDELAVSGRATWDRDRKRTQVDLTLDGALTGRLRGGWDTRAVGAEAVLRGTVSGKQVRLTFPAP